MAIDRSVKQARSRYQAIITNQETTVEALVHDDEVALKVPGMRGIVRVPIAEWHGFFELVRGIGQAIEEKRQVEEAQVPLPWEQPTGSPMEQLDRMPVQPEGSFVTVPVEYGADSNGVVHGYPGTPVVRDAVTGQPVAEPPYGLDSPDEEIVPDPFPPRVQA